jgi:hypothetical protein
MGSEISLAVGNFEVDWGKNSTFNGHNQLFQGGDVRSVEYSYVDSRGEPIIEKKNACVKLLRDVVPRLELLGRTRAAARREYDNLLKSNDHRLNITFDDLAGALKRCDPKLVSRDYDEGYDFGEFFANEIYHRLKLKNLGETPWASRDDLGEVMENFHPWSVLRLLGENPVSLSLPVTWYFADLVDNGWAPVSDFIPGLQDSERFLIVTEGSSDAKILRKALDLLRPDVSDFFYFVDMQEGYPFTGTGNLHRFCQGLAAIKILNRVVVLYDNDCEGRAKYDITKALSLPGNMRILRLPDLSDFKRFPTVGPNGRKKENINGRAAAIECYLDMNWKTDVPPVVRWTSYNAAFDRYHGELACKDKYKREFLNLKRRESRYDFARMTAVLELLVGECVRMAAGDD